MSQPQKYKKEQQQPEGMRGYMQYADMAFRMGVIILIGAFAGKKLDQWLAFKRPFMTILLSLLSVAGALYIVLKDLIKKP